MLVMRIGSPGTSKTVCPWKIGPDNLRYVSNQIFDFWSHGWQNSYTFLTVNIILHVFLIHCSWDTGIDTTARSELNLTIYQRAIYTLKLNSSYLSCTWALNNYRSVVKERPWVVHLTCSPNRALYEFPCSSIKECPCLWFALVHRQLSSTTFHNSCGLLVQ